MVFNRPRAPTGKPGCLRWLDSVAMPFMPEGVTHQHPLRAMDALMDHAGRVEMERAKQIRPPVDRELSFIFSDLTTVRIHGVGHLEDDTRAFGINRELDGIARQSVPGLVRTADGLPRMHIVHPGNVAETKTLQGMLSTVLAHVPIQRASTVADRGLPSLDSCPSGAIGSSPMGGGDLTALADQGGRRPDFVLVVPARRYGNLIGACRNLAFDGEGHSESTCIGHRRVVARDPLRALLRPIGEAPAPPSSTPSPGR